LSTGPGFGGSGQVLYVAYERNAGGQPIMVAGSNNPDGAFTFGAPVIIPGNGWAYMDAERHGKNLYVVYEADANAPGDIFAMASHDEGATFDKALSVV